MVLQTLVLHVYAFFFFPVVVSSLAFTHGALYGLVCGTWLGLNPPLQIAPGQPQAL